MNYLATASDAEEADLSELPAGVSHLLVADDALAPGHWTGTYVAVCGVLVRRSGFPSSSCSPECEWECPLYCSECVREAHRWSAPLPASDGQPDPGTQAGEAHDDQPLARRNACLGIAEPPAMPPS